MQFSGAIAVQVYNDGVRRHANVGIIGGPTEL
jgi:hypothetical protein